MVVLRTGPLLGVVWWSRSSQVHELPGHGGSLLFRTNIQRSTVKVCMSRFWLLYVPPENRHTLAPIYQPHTYTKEP